MNSTGLLNIKIRGRPSGLQSPSGSFPSAGGTALGPYPGLFASNLLFPSGVNCGSPPFWVLNSRVPPVRHQMPLKSCGSNGSVDGVAGGLPRPPNPAPPRCADANDGRRISDSKTKLNLIRILRIVGLPTAGYWVPWQVIPGPYRYR